MKSKMYFAVIIEPNQLAKIVSKQLRNFSLDQLQQMVSGNIQFVRLPKPYNFDAVVNEEGLLLNLSFNPTASRILNDHIVGPLVIITKSESQATELIQFINSNRSDSRLNENPRPFNRTLNDSDRSEWIDNDEGLYNMWKSSKLSKKAFIRQNREDIDNVINNALEGRHHLVPTLHENPRGQQYPIRQIPNSADLEYRGNVIKMRSEGGYWMPYVNNEVLGAFPANSHGYSNAVAVGMSAIDNLLGKYELHENPENGGLAIILSVATIAGLAFGGWWLWNKYNAPGGSAAITLVPGSQTIHGFKQGGTIAIGLPANAVGWYSLSVDGNASVASPSNGAVPITVYPGNPSGTITASWIISTNSTAGLPSMSNPMQTATIAYGA